MAKLQRSSGILMPIFSLPSNYGIGSIGQAAYEFVDFLVAAGQKYWQILPVGPTSYGDSPYQSFSTFAGNPYFIDLDMLVEEGFLKKQEINSADFGDDKEHIDYYLMYQNRFKVLEKAVPRVFEKKLAEYADFTRKNEGWLKEYALFMAVKKHFGDLPWNEWPDEEIRLHRPHACDMYRKMLSKQVEFYSVVQYLFFSQWNRLKSYANSKNIQIIGDMPIYVAMDSADVWSEPHWFQLDEKNYPVAVAGVPPDYFTADGQLWGNPLYDWDRMEADGFGWWIRRVDGAGKLYDVLRIDHFRGFESYWAVPYGDTTAINGHWVKGPGMRIIGVLQGWFPDISFIAEDLGYLTQEVKDLLKASGLPGMKILEFAFDSREAADYLPHSYIGNCVCYTGTHDNPPLMLWKDEASEEDIMAANDYLGLNDREGFNYGIIRGGMSSVADLFVAQMQDYLELGEGCRINVPGKLGGNWTWRMRADAITPGLAEKIRYITGLYKRLN